MGRKKGRKRAAADSLPHPPKTGDFRIIPVDILKGLAAISVILIHTFSPVLLSVTGAPYHIWQAVPVFLLLAAFTGALSYRWLDRTTLSGLYDLAILIRRYKRILVPFAVVWAVEVIVLLLLPQQMSWYAGYSGQILSGGVGIVVSFFSGGIGPGNYFIPLIIVQIFAIPILYWLAVRFSPGKMVVSIFILDMVFQYVLYLAGIHTFVPGLTYVNYVVLTALGIWLALEKHPQTAVLAAAGILSAAYITAVYYFNFQFWFIAPLAGFFSEFSYFWTLVLVVTGLRFLPSTSLSKAWSIVADLGKASWHIFLVQMAFLAFFNDSLLAFIDSAIPGPDLGWLLVAQVGFTLLVLAVCLPAGYGFYRAGEYLGKR
ncbi:MAG: hypothetical protein A4E35_01685 [Methanoregula sp. PtaU1.Bin051]|nr:MAG: hypothetical protein A4E35_01685 [Methanoregula sp. PtaU1.Bin051]